MNDQIYFPSISIALYDRASKAKDQGEACNVILLCTASMEAFINEYLEFGQVLIEMDKEKRAEIERNRKNNRLRGKFISHFSAFYPEEEKLISELSEHEIQRKNIFVKINTIKKNCLGEEWKKNHSVYRDYCTLVKLRNALTHPRSKAVKYGDIDIPKFLLPFYQQKNIKYFNEINKNMSWVAAIDTVEFSKWCIKAFEKMMILLLLDMYHAKVKSLPNFPVQTIIRAGNYLSDFRFPVDVLKEISSTYVKPDWVD